MARIGPLLVLLALAAGCGFVGAGEITVEARNSSDFPMRIQVVSGAAGDGEAHGPAHVVEPLEERSVELAVPGGDWVVTVNGARMLDSSDAAGRRGRLPVTLILPAPDDPVGVPHWEAPMDWAGNP